MSIQVNNLIPSGSGGGGQDLRLSANITVNTLTGGTAYNTNRTIDGVSAKYGHWRAFFVELPASPTLNTQYFMIGSTGGSTTSNGSRTSIGGNNASQSPNQLKPYGRYRNGATDAVVGYATDITALTVTPNVFLVVDGISQVETAPGSGIFEWRWWAATCQVGGSPDHHINPSAITGSFETSTTPSLLGRILLAEGTTADRTPNSTRIENVALVSGDFPWDTANNRPHYSALLALANGTGAGTLYTYATLIAEQNAGTLGYSNLRASKADLRYWWKLDTLIGTGTALDGQTPMLNSGTGGTATLTVNSFNSSTNGVVGGVAISPAHWNPVVQPVIVPPAVKFFGGRGTRNVNILITHDSAVERRWEDEGGTALTGFDWASVPSSGDNWLTADQLPVGGLYTLRVRQTSNTANEAAPLTGVMVGTVAVQHGQSGSQRIWATSTQFGGNNFSVAADAGVLGTLVRTNNSAALTSTVATSLVAGQVYQIYTLGTTDFTLVGAASNTVGLTFTATGAGTGNGEASQYTKPVIQERQILGGTTPTASYSTVMAMNRWNALNPGHPLCIVNMAVSGTDMDDWADNVPVEDNAYLFGFMGTFGNTPEETAVGNDANNSGLVDLYAQALGRWADAHLFMWMPNISSSQAKRTLYTTGVTDRWNANSTAPWIVFPPYRMSDNSGSTPSGRQAGTHTTFTGELGAIGYAGPYYPDIVADLTGSLHPAYNNGTAPATVTDVNYVGSSRAAVSVVQTLYNCLESGGAVNTRVTMLTATYGATNAVINIDTGRALRTLNGAAIFEDAFEVFDGTAWRKASDATHGFSVALDTDIPGRIILTKDTGTWASSGILVEYSRGWLFSQSYQAGLGRTESNTEADLDGMLYDAATYRGRVNVTPDAGNILESTPTGAGLPVTVAGSAQLFATEKMSGTRDVVIRMMDADGVTVLKEKTITVTVSM